MMPDAPDDLIDALQVAVMAWEATATQDGEVAFRGMKQNRSGVGSMEDAKRVLRKYRPALTILKIQHAVADGFHIDIRDIGSKRRNSDIVRARHAAMYLCRELTGYSYPEIAKRFGDRDHTTIIYGVREAEARAECDVNFGDRVHSIKQHLLGSP